MKKIILFSFLLITATACYYDKLEEITPNQPGTGGNTTTCDTAAAVTYTAKIQPILSKYCTGCHSGTSGSGGVSLNTYETAKAVAQSGKLYGSVSWDGSASKMPKGGNKISDCDIALIKKWASNSYAQ
jgi:mono/diheme cytochrome c family protein